MIKKNILGLLFLLSTLCLFNSCEDDPYYDDRYDLTSALCSGTWSETYTTNNGEDCYHVLSFYSDWTGSDYYEFYRGNILVRRTEEAFRWHWDDDNYYTPTPSIWIFQMEPTRILKIYRSEASSSEAYWTKLMSYSQWNNKKRQS